MTRICYSTHADTSAKNGRIFERGVFRIKPPESNRFGPHSLNENWGNDISRDWFNPILRRIEGRRLKPRDEATGAVASSSHKLLKFQAAYRVIAEGDS